MIMNKNYIPNTNLGSVFKQESDHPSKTQEGHRFDEENFNMDTSGIVIPNVKRAENFAGFSGNNSQEYQAGIFNSEVVKNFGINSGLGKNKSVSSLKVQTWI